MGWISFLSTFLLGATTASAALVYLYLTEEEKNRKRAAEGKDPTGIFAQSKTTSLNRSAAALTADSDLSFFTNLIARLWPNIRVVAAASIRETMDPMLAEMSPKLRLVNVDIGQTPLRLDNLVVHERKGDSVQFDVDVVWKANAVDIKLAAVFGSFGIKAIRLSGRMSVLLKPITDDASLISAVQYSFVNTPVMELDFSGLASIADFKVIDNQIEEIIRDSMESMVVLPLRMTYKLVETVSMDDTYQPPIGLVRLTAVKGRGFVVEKHKFGKDDVPDVYLNVTLGTSKPVWRTATVKDSLEPVWTDQSHDFLLCDYDQIVTVHAWDEDHGQFDADDDLGLVQTTVGSLLLSGGTQELALNTSDDKCTGAFVTIRADVLPLTQEWDSFDNASPTASESLKCGVLTVLLSSAKEVPLAKEAGTNAVSVQVQCGDSKWQSPAICDTEGYDAINPVWDAIWHLPVSSAQIKDPIVLTLRNGEDVVVAMTTVTPDELKVAKDHQLLKQQCIISGTENGYFEYSLILSGVQVNDASVPTPTVVSSTPTTKKRGLFRRSKKATPSPQTTVNPSAGSGSASQGSSDAAVAMAPLPAPLPDQPPGTVRVVVLSGRGFQIEKKRLRKNDIPDVYCKVSFGTKTWRTSTIKNNLTPVWNQSQDFMLSSDHSAMLQLEAWDENSRGKDDYVGKARVTVGKLLLASGRPVEIEVMDQDDESTGCFLLLKAFAAPVAAPDVAAAPAPSNDVVVSERGAPEADVIVSEPDSPPPEADEPVLVAKPPEPPTLSDIPSPTPPMGKIRITAVSGRGFQIEKKRLRKNDVPDVYCKIGLGTKTWRTSTIKDDVSPVWNESEEFVLQDKSHLVQLDVWDENRRGSDDYLGHARLNVGKLLEGEVVEVELTSDENKHTGYFVSLSAIMV